MVKVLALGRFFQLGGAGPLRQLLVSDIKCFPYDKNITVYSHTKQKRKNISTAYKLSYDSGRFGRFGDNRES